eukprot:6876285-Prymnesium_polylepis.1
MAHENKGERAERGRLTASMLSSAGTVLKSILHSSGRSALSVNSILNVRGISVAAEDGMISSIFRLSADSNSSPRSNLAPPPLGFAEHDVTCDPAPRD